MPENKFIPKIAKINIINTIKADILTKDGIRKQIVSISTLRLFEALINLTTLPNLKALAIIGNVLSSLVLIKKLERITISVITKIEKSNLFQESLK